LRSLELSASQESPLTVRSLSGLKMVVAEPHDSCYFGFLHVDGAGKDAMAPSDTGRSATEQGFWLLKERTCSIVLGDETTNLTDAPIALDLFLDR
jgi:hypothetical protein